MPIPNSRLMDNSVDEKKIKDSAVRRIVLAEGERFEVIGSNGFTILRVDNDTRKVTVRGNVDKIRGQ